MAAGCGLFISEEALNIWVCPLYWYFWFTSSSLYLFGFCTVSVLYQQWLIIKCCLKMNDLWAYNLGWHNFSTDAVFGWDMAIFCWIFLEKCSVHNIHSSVGILVSCSSILTFNALQTLLHNLLFVNESIWEVKPTNIGLQERCSVL